MFDVKQFWRDFEAIIVYEDEMEADKGTKFNEDSPNG